MNTKNQKKPETKMQPKINLKKLADLFAQSASNESLDKSVRMFAAQMAILTVHIARIGQVAVRADQHVAELSTLVLSAMDQGGTSGEEQPQEPRQAQRTSPPQSPPPPQGSPPAPGTAMTIASDERAASEEGAGPDIDDETALMAEEFMREATADAAKVNGTATDGAA